jgi:hypothetical protein
MDVELGRWPWGKNIYMEGIKNRSRWNHDSETSQRVMIE